MNIIWVIAGVVMLGLIVFIAIEHVKKAVMTGLMIGIGILIVLSLLGFTYYDNLTGWISAWPF